MCVRVRVVPMCVCVCNCGSLSETGWGCITSPRFFGAVFIYVVTYECLSIEPITGLGHRRDGAADRGVRRGGGGQDEEVIDLCLDR